MANARPDPSTETLRHLEQRLGELQDRLRSRADPVAVSERLDRLRALRDEAQATLRAIEAEADAVLLDAGPFPDWTALVAFRRALTQRDWVIDVELRSLHGRRALLALRGPPEGEIAAALGARAQADGTPPRLVIDL